MKYGTLAYSLTVFFVTGCSIRPKIVKINLKKLDIEQIELYV